MLWWQDSSSSKTYIQNENNNQTIPTSTRAKFHLPCTINMSNKSFGFSGMFEVIKGNLWMDEVRPIEEVRERSSSLGTLIRTLPVQSREMVLKVPTPKGTRLRTAKTVDMANKDFDLQEIFDNRKSALDEFVASMAEDQISPCDLSLFERMKGWQIETRERKNGKFDKFYHHKRSKKMFRSMLMVKMFVKNTGYPQGARRRQKDKKTNGQGSLVYNCYAISQHATLKRKRNSYLPFNIKPTMVEDFEAKSQHYLLNYLACKQREILSPAGCSHLGILKAEGDGKFLAS